MLVVRSPGVGTGRGRKLRGPVLTGTETDEAIIQDDEGQGPKCSQEEDKEPDRVGQQSRGCPVGYGSVTEPSSDTQEL